MDSSCITAASGWRSFFCSASGRSMARRTSRRLSAATFLRPRLPPRASCLARLILTFASGTRVKNGQGNGQLTPSKAGAEWMIHRRTKTRHRDCEAFFRTTPRGSLVLGKEGWQGIAGSRLLCPMSTCTWPLQLSQLSKASSTLSRTHVWTMCQ